MLDLGDIDRYVTKRLAFSVTPQERMKHINEVYLDLTRFFTIDHTEKITVTAAEFVTVPARKVEFIICEGERLRKVHKQSFLYPLAAGKPKYWAEWGNNEIVFAPIPDAEYDLEIYIEPEPEALATNDAVVKYIPEEYQYLVAWGALAVLAATQEDWSLAQYWETKYRDGVNEMLRYLGLSKRFSNLRFLAGGGKNV